MRGTASLPACSAGRRRRPYPNSTDLRGVEACEPMTEGMPSGLVLTILCVRGGRDVLLNLRIRTERTVVLGVDGHICELQLILRSFVELKVL
jgi:hypothetical protein